MVPCAATELARKGAAGPGMLQVDSVAPSQRQVARGGGVPASRPPPLGHV